MLTPPARVRDRAAAPAAHLVAEQAHPADPAGSDRACRHHASTSHCGCRGRRDLDRVAAAVELDHQRGVVQAASRAVLTPPRSPRRRGRCSGPSAPPAPSRNPVEIDGCLAHAPPKWIPVRGPRPEAGAIGICGFPAGSSSDRGRPAARTNARTRATDRSGGADGVDGEVVRVGLVVADVRRPSGAVRGRVAVVHRGVREVLERHAAAGDPLSRVTGRRHRRARDPRVRNPAPRARPRPPSSP